MREKNGFTLVEVLFFTVLAVLLTLYTLPKVIDLLDTSKKELYQTQIKTLEKGTRDYYIKNDHELPTDEKDARFMTISKLFKNQFIDSDEVIDPRNGKRMNGCVVVTPAGKEYHYNYTEDTCDKSASKYVPKIKVDGKKTRSIEINEEFEFPKVTAKDVLGEELNVTGPYLNNELITTLDTSKLNDEIILEYRSYDDLREITGKTSIKVVVEDNTPPVIKVNGKTKSFTYTQPLSLEKLEKFNVECTDNSDLSPDLKVTSSVSHVKGKGTITYLAKDKSGNISALVVTVDVTDSQEPAILKVSGNRSVYSKEPIVLEVMKEKHLGNTLEYSFDGGATWQKENKKEIKENGSIQIVIKDMFNNKSSIWLEEVTTIDTKKPTVPKVTLKTDNWLGEEYQGTWTNKTVYALLRSEDADSKVVSYEYSTNGTDFKKMNPKMIFEDNMNTTYYFRSEDAAGNKSDLTAGYPIKIDKQKINVPTLTLRDQTGKKLEVGKKVWTSGVISIENILTTKTSGSPIIHYEVSKDDKYTYDISDTNYEFNKNMKETYYFRSVDEAGNKSDWTRPVYLLIDRVRPSTPQLTLKIKDKNGLTYPPGGLVDKPIYVKLASVDSGSGIDYYQWSTDSINWKNLKTDEYLFTENINSKVYFRAVDKVGNVSLENVQHLNIQK